MCGNSFWVEAITLLYHVCYSMMEPSIKVHIFESLCLTGNFTDCKTLLENKELEDKVQEYAANQIVYLKLLRSLPSLLTILMCGAWSDSIGRKVPILFPFIGMLLSLVVYLVSYATKNRLSTILVGGTISGIFGEVGLILMAGYSYVTDVTDSYDRTRRLGRLMAMSYFGQFLGSLIVSIMIKFTLVRNVFILATVLCGLSIVAIITFLQDSLHNKTSTVMLCQVHYLWDTFQVIAKPREHKKRAYIIIIMACIALHQACLWGEIDITMLYVRHRPLSWSSHQYGYYLTGGYLCSGLGTILLLPVLSGHFKRNDFALSMAAVGFKVVQVLWLAFSVDSWMVYFGIPLMIVSSMFIPALKSILSKLIDEDEIGKIFGVAAFGETVSGVLGALMFTAVYAKTVHLSFSGLAFILEALVNIGVFGCILWMSVDFARCYGTRRVEDIVDKPAQNGDLEKPVSDTEKRYSADDIYAGEADPLNEAAAVTKSASGSIRSDEGRRSPTPSEESEDYQPEPAARGRAPAPRGRASAPIGGAPTPREGTPAARSPVGSRPQDDVYGY